MLSERERLERSCRQLLMTAAIWSDSGRQSVFEAYQYAYTQLSGMERALGDIYEFEYMALVANYRRAADTKVFQALGISLFK